MPRCVEMLPPQIDVLQLTGLISLCSVHPFDGDIEGAF